LEKENNKPVYDPDKSWKIGEKEFKVKISLYQLELIINELDGLNTSGIDFTKDDLVVAVQLLDILKQLIKGGKARKLFSYMLVPVQGKWNEDTAKETEELLKYPDFVEERMVEIVKNFFFTRMNLSKGILNVSGSSEKMKSEPTTT